MKIAHVISTFPPKVGGMGRVCFEEVKRLADLGHEVTVFTLNYPDLDLSWDQKQNFKIVRLKSWRLGDAGIVWRLFFVLKNFDLVHLHYPFYGAYEWILLAKLFWHQKYLLTYHMDASPVGFLKKNLQKIYDFFWAYFLLKNSEMTIGVDDEHLKRVNYQKIVNYRSREILHLGVDGNFFHPLETKNYQLGELNLKDKKVILFVGNLIPFKRLDLILKALKEISDPEIFLVVVGGGYQMEIYQKMARDLEIDKQVIFVGRCNARKDLINFYNLAQVLILPSSEAESFSLVILEALACGLPVIASDLAGIRGRVSPEKDGFLFEVGSVDDLVLKIKTFFNLSEEEQRAMSVFGREKVLKEYSWDRHLSSLIKIYERILGKN